MDEIEKQPNVASLTKQLSGFVSWKITWLSSVTRESQVKATLANLRRGVGKVPGELPEIWGVLFQNFPQALIEKTSDRTVKGRMGSIFGTYFICVSSAGTRY